MGFPFGILEMFSGILYDSFRNIWDCSGFLRIFGTFWDFFGILLTFLRILLEILIIFEIFRDCFDGFGIIQDFWDPIWDCFDVVGIIQDSFSTSNTMWGILWDLLEPIGGSILMQGSLGMLEGFFQGSLKDIGLAVDWRGAEATLGFDDFPRSYCCCITITWWGHVTAIITWL